MYEYKLVNETYKVGISLDIILFVSKLKTEVKLSKLPKKLKRTSTDEPVEGQGNALECEVCTYLAALTKIKHENGDINSAISLSKPMTDIPHRLNSCFHLQPLRKVPTFAYAGTDALILLLVFHSLATTCQQ